MNLTKKEQARYRAIIRDLSRLSRNGWAHATHPDYDPLEAELKVLANKMTRSAKGEHK